MEKKASPHSLGTYTDNREYYLHSGRKKDSNGKRN